ncbi:MAG: OmpA family protein [Saprospiraceae bacterium]|nr:OmpA family protein [Saprospiraceae bacterium]
MKHILLAFIFAAFASTVILAQEAEEHKNLFGAKVLFIDYGIINDVDDLNITNGIELSYIRSLHKNFSVALPLKVGLANVPGVTNNLTFGSLDALLHIKAPGKIVTPYIFGGAGATAAESEDLHYQFPVGAGFKFRVGANSFINLQGEYRKATADNRDNLQAGIGVLFRLGKLADADGDGIPDAMDDCPNEPGPEATNGCPDRDGDGIPDRTDRCPDAAGPAETRGCPDTDGDGFIDIEDDCPTEPGTVKGCPDRDGDGIPDKDDACPDEAGPASLQGCPDRDGDGIPDKDDECPDEAGPAETRGCPVYDRDGDGVPDEEDRCPDLAGPASLQGCPDRDGDGVPDIDDRCPDEPGLITNKGCPELKEEVKQVLSTAMRAVQFETGKSILKTESFPILDQVVQVMRDYPAYHLRIKGHTDSVGKAEANQTLSENRARTCYQYLINSGISADRLSFAGLGQTMPIADNKNSAGRALNRRVEFDLFLP